MEEFHDGSSFVGSGRLIAAGAVPGGPKAQSVSAKRQASFLRELCRPPSSPINAPARPGDAWWRPNSIAQLNSASVRISTVLWCPLLWLARRSDPRRWRARRGIDPGGRDRRKVKVARPADQRARKAGSSGWNCSARRRTGYHWLAERWRVRLSDQWTARMTGPSSRSIARLLLAHAWWQVAGSGGVPATPTARLGRAAQNSATAVPELPGLRE